MGEDALFRQLAARFDLLGGLRELRSHPFSPRRKPGMKARTLCLGLRGKGLGFRAPVPRMKAKTLLGFRV